MLIKCPLLVSIDLVASCLCLESLCYLSWHELYRYSYYHGVTYIGKWDWILWSLLRCCQLFLPSVSLYSNNILYFQVCVHVDIPYNDNLREMKLDLLQKCCLPKVKDANISSSGGSFVIKYAHSHNPFLYGWHYLLICDQLSVFVITMCSRTVLVL